jgi:large subunit ribosomal protein L25
LEVEALPGDLPERIVIDLSLLKQIGDSVHVRDLNLPDSVTVITSPDEIIVVVAAPLSDAALAGEDGGPSEPEVIERGKKDEDF